MKNNLPTTIAQASRLLLTPKISSAEPPSLPTEFGSRLVTLCDGRPGLRGGLLAEVLEPDAADSAGTLPILDFIASSETLDRYEEIIAADGWQLANYRRNPVFQNAHQYGDIIFTLGKALLTEVRQLDGRSVLFQRVEFATDVNPMARIAYGLYRGKFLNAVSVGFIPIRWENGSAEAGYRRRYLEQELLEVSAVGIPANPEALQLGLTAGAIQPADLRALLDTIEQSPAFAGRLSALTGEKYGTSPDFCSQTAAPETITCALGLRRYEAQLLQLARALEEVLRET